MIIDKIENLNRYKNLHEGFVKAAIAISSGLPTEKKFEIDGTNIWGLNLAYSLRAESEPLWEAHRKHLDVHIVLEGEERIDIEDISAMETTTEYSDQDDYQLFKGEKLRTIILKPGYFMILFPNEVHRVGIKIENEIPIKKLVLKFKILE